MDDLFLTNHVSNPYYRILCVEHFALTKCSNAGRSDSLLVVQRLSLAPAEPRNGEPIRMVTSVVVVINGDLSGDY